LGFSGLFSITETAVRKRAFISDGTLSQKAQIRPMKINVERGAFLKALSHVQSVVERRNTIPILSNVMMEAGKGALKLTATDLDIEIVESIPADILRNGSATAPAHMLHDIVRKLPDGAQVQVELLTSEGGPKTQVKDHTKRGAKRAKKTPAKPAFFCLKIRLFSWFF
jgi:hypothetical protein